MSSSNYGLFDFINSILAMPVCMAIEIPLNTGVSILRSPRVLWEAYKTLWNTKVIGPNLKVLAALLIPPALAVKIGLIAVGSGVMGIARGFISDGFLGSVADSFKDANYVWKRYDEFFDSLTPEKVIEIPDGKKPYDIRVIDTLKSVITSIFSVPLNATIPLAQAAHFIVEFYPRIFRHLITEMGDAPFMKLAVMVGLILGLPLIPVGTVVGTVGYGIYKAAVTTYKEGFGAGCKTLFNGIRKAHSYFSSFIKGVKDSTR